MKKSLIIVKTKIEISLILFQQRTEVFLIHFPAIMSFSFITNNTSFDLLLKSITSSQY